MLQWPGRRNSAAPGELCAVPDEVLLVLSDTRLRAFALAQLQEEGYQVVAAPDFAAARRLLSRGLRPQLVVADLSVASDADLEALAGGGLLGLAVAGHLDRQRAARLGLPCVRRPFTVGQLVEHVRRLTGR